MQVALEARGGETSTLRLSGALRTGWCGNLTTGLAERGIGIVRGEALRVAAGDWRAEFELALGKAPSPSPEELSALLARETGAGFTTPLTLHRYELEQAARHGGSLRLAVEADDQVGFLAALLRRLAYFSLFPMELQVETLEGRIQDRLWLGGVGGSAPHAETERALGLVLAKLV